MKNLAHGRGRYQAVAIIGTLGLAIGAVVAIVSLVTCARVKPLPYTHPAELRMLWHAYRGLGSPKNAISVPSYELYKSTCGSIFTDVAALGPVRDGNVVLSDGVEPISVRTLSLTPNTFSVLGVKPLDGRSFVNEDAQVTGVVPVISSYDFWREHFGGHDAIGKRITVNGRGAQIIGVMPQQFQVIEAVDLWIPLAFTNRDLAPTEHGNEYLTAIARLRPHVDDTQLKYGLGQVAASIRSQFPEYYPERFGWYIYSTTITEELTGRYHSELVLLSVAALVLGIIALVNVSALLLARSTLKAHDYGVKLALGSNRPRIVVEIMAEMVLIAAAANGIGLLVASSCIKLFRIYVLPHIGQNVPPWNSVSIDFYSTFLVLVLATCILVALGLLPVRLMDHKNISSSVQSLSRETMGRKHSVLLNVLVASDIAIALILCVLSAQLLLTISRLNLVNPGFSSAGVETFRVVLPRSTYGTRAAFDSFQDSLLSELQHLPEIKAAGLTSSLPFLNSEANALLVIEGRHSTAPAEVNYITANQNYFNAMEIPLLAGRVFNSSDSAQAVTVVVIDHAAAQRFFPGVDPIGKRVAFTFEKEPNGTPRWREVIGVVGHIRDQTLRDDTDTQFYVPYLQVPPKGYTYIVKGRSTDMAPVFSAVRTVLSRIDPKLPLHHVRPLEAIVSDSFAFTSIAATLVLFFATAAIILTIVGVYGTVSYSVLLRRREIGVRVAFGATREKILYHILGRYLALAGIGILVAIPLSIGLGFWVRSVLFNVTPYEWSILSVTILFVAMLTFASSYFPAVSASRCDPARVLRID
jgi:predicted permease